MAVQPRWGEGLHRAEINGLVHLLSWGRGDCIYSHQRDAWISAMLASGEEKLGLLEIIISVMQPGRFVIYFGFAVFLSNSEKTV